MKSIYENDIYLVIRLLGEAIFLRSNTPDISCSGHRVWNIKFFFVYCDVIMKIVNLFSMPCALLCFSSNYFVLRIARYNEYIIEKSMPVAGLFKLWVCVCSLLGLGLESHRGHGYLSFLNDVCCQV